MEKFKINLKTPIESILDLTKNILTQTFNEDFVEIELNKPMVDLTIGQKVFYERSLYKGDGKYENIHDTSNIIELDDRKTKIKIAPPKKEKYNIKHSYLTTNNEIRLTFSKIINIFQQDLAENDFNISLYDINHELISAITSNNIYIPLRMEDKALTSEDCISLVDVLENCGINCEKTKVYEYTFLPYIVSRNSIVIKYNNELINNDLYKDIKFVEFDYNPYFYLKENSNICYNYNDNWADNFNDNDCTIYNVSGTSINSIGLYDAFYKLNIGISADLNELDLGSEDTFGETFINTLEEELIPPFIDMERIKYSPCDSKGNTVTGLTFYLHFRERARIKDNERKTHNSIYTTGNTYYDSWHIDNEYGDITWWNGFNYNGNSFSINDFNTFHNASGKTSDLIGFLNFTDSDIFYRKQKVSKSFLRLSFYNSTDPIEQKLLYYSTIFLDGGELYGKYIKQLQEVKKSRQTIGNNTIVFKSDGENRVDTKITVTNEYNRLKSSEGFNLYLFAEDQQALENGEKTIYMRVEFNHAGNGKTIPMIAWPKKNNAFCPLTIDNFFNSLYIPVKLKYINDGYVYLFEDINAINNNIELVLYEPKLDQLVNTGDEQGEKPDNGNEGGDNEGNGNEEISKYNFNIQIINISNYTINPNEVYFKINDVIEYIPLMETGSSTTTLNYSINENEKLILGTKKSMKFGINGENYNSGEQTLLENKEYEINMKGGNITIEITDYNIQNNEPEIPEVPDIPEEPENPECYVTINIENNSGKKIDKTIYLSINNNKTLSDEYLSIENGKTEERTYEIVEGLSISLNTEYENMQFSIDGDEFTINNTESKVIFKGEGDNLNKNKEINIKIIKIDYSSEPDIEEPIEIGSLFLGFRIDFLQSEYGYNGTPVGGIYIYGENENIQFEDKDKNKGYLDITDEEGSKCIMVSEDDLKEILNDNETTYFNILFFGSNSYEINKGGTILELNEESKSTLRNGGKVIIVK